MSQNHQLPAKLSFRDLSVSTILFDVNGVLTTLSDAAVSAASARHAPLKNPYDKSLTADLYTGKLSVDAYAAAVVEKVFDKQDGFLASESCTVEKLTAVAKDVLDACRETAPVDAIVGFAAIAKALGFKIGIISDTWAEGQKKETYDVVFRPFKPENIFLSHQVGLAKNSASAPEAIFLHACKSMNVDPTNCCYIDDKAKCCDAAAKAGIKTTVLFDQNNPSHLKQLLAALVSCN